MGTVGWIILGVAALALVYLVIVHNRLVRLRALMREGWSGITVQPRRRADLVPNLVATVEGYAAHERTLLEAVTAHRADPVAAKGVDATARADTQFSGMLGKLVAVAEAYPDLKADANFRQLQDELSEVEEELSGARRYYNATVRDLNTRIQSFPRSAPRQAVRFRRGRTLCRRHGCIADGAAGPLRRRRASRRCAPRCSASPPPSCCCVPAPSAPTAAPTSCARGN